MTKFEQRGINFQYDATTKEQAQKSFQYSCDCCCNKGMRNQLHPQNGCGVF